MKYEYATRNYPGDLSPELYGRLEWSMKDAGWLQVYLEVRTEQIFQVWRREMREITR